MRSGVVGLAVAAVLAAALTGCGGDDDRAIPDDAALPAYLAPSGAPDFCTDLAASRELGDLPTSMGTLTTGPDVVARTQVSRAVQEMRNVLAEVRSEGGQEQLAAALEELVAALRSVLDGELTDPVRAAVSDGLRRVGEQAQPTCGFPT
ncbi:hypothetical protein [Blastococcus sp. CCUG 61487]|uniref:hypothetical protein n=1 Tax=Blastococcus sp. CCUG 61487 TaxID=1840703 RepID=UPI0010C08C80|nr:hypothetical protein [Blastococcus sp. CCUG 61487]